MAGVPRRKAFAEGEEGRKEWKAAFNSYAGDFAYSHVGTETVKGRMGAVGMWGDYCEREGHGEFVKWERKSSGTLRKFVVPVRDAATGQIKVPDAECIAEYIMVMAIGDTKARPKGGTAEYRVAWHHGSEHAHFKLRAREHGRGPYADTPEKNGKGWGGTAYGLTEDQFGTALFPVATTSLVGRFFYAGPHVPMRRLTV